MINNPMPILMIDGKTKIFAYLDQDHQLVVSSKKLSKFTKNLWFKYLGATKQKFYPQDISSNFQVKEGNCFYHTKGVKIRMDCKDKAYLHLTGEIISEKISLNINNESDSYFIYLIGGQFLIKSNARQNRLWQ